MDADVDIEVRRSPRRRRTVSAYREGARVIVLIPAAFTPAEEREWVSRMVTRVLAPPRVSGDDTDLTGRAQELAQRYLDDRAAPAAVRWVAPMRSRWASCTPVDATIRVDERVRQMPIWVQDYVLVHELAHLIEPGHGPAFWALVQRYPRTERARGYLDGISAASAARSGDPAAG